MNSVLCPHFHPSEAIGGREGVQFPVSAPQAPLGWGLPEAPNSYSVGFSQKEPWEQANVGVSAGATRALTGSLLLPIEGACSASDQPP